MKAKESRIGNYYRTFDGRIDGYRINQITLFDFEYINNAGGDLKDYGFEPIPLTEEWLLKSGWKQIDKYTFTLNSWFIYKRKRGFVTGSKNRETKLEYLHDLQNWWYGNNKEELQFNKHLYKKDLTPCDICGGTKLHSYNCEKTTNLK
jgi:hypothetical protein